MRYALRSFFSILDYGRIPDDIADALVTHTATPVVAAPATAPQAAQDPSERALQVLALLQRDGRLMDFLMEDLTGYQDAQVGAAVRDVHAGCRAALDRYAQLVPVIDDPEGSPVTVERGSDPARVKIVGHVAGEPPYRGVLRHRGWEALRLELPPLPASGRTILAPAEVEVA